MFYLLQEPLGKIFRGKPLMTFLQPLLHSLNEVMENIEVCHEFWFEEATDLTTKPYSDETPREISQSSAQ